MALAKRVDSYVLRQTLRPLLITLGISALLLLLERMLRVFDLVVNQGGPFLVVWKMLANLLPHYLSLALPAGLFLGILLAFRKLSLSSEMDALQASGLSLMRLIRPAIVLAVVLAVADLFLLGYVQPVSRYTYRNLVFDLSSGAFGASIKVAEYNQLGEGLTLRIEESRDDGQKLLGVFLRRDNGNGRVQTVSAREGSFLSTGDGLTMLLRLRDGVLVEVDPTKTSPTVLSFALYDWPVELPQALQFRQRGGQQLELTLTELWQSIRDPGPKGPDPEYVSAFYSRIVRVLGILVLPFLAAPLGFTSKRSGRAFGMTFGILALITYHKVLEFGEALVALGLTTPFIGLWLPTLIFAALSGLLFQRTTCRVGANPLEPLENAWTDRKSVV